MEKFIERENVLLGYSARRSSENSDELDFNDVFGGPPRRFSTQEVKGRHSFSESVESEEKPVFGSEVVTRRRYLGDGFFNDIFGGDESYGSPGSRDRDNPFGSNPGSRISSPARDLTPKAEVFGMSLPVQLSLPAKSAKATENPTFVPGYHRHHKMDGINNGISSPRSSNSTLSRFSSRATSGLDEMGNDVHHSVSLSGEVPFTNEDLTHGGVSDEVPFTNEDLTNGGMSDKKDVGKRKKGSKSMETPNNLFHFSIYKWAGREFPMVIPLRGGKFSKLKEMNRVDRSASSNGRMESMEQESSTLEDHEILTNIEVNVVSVKPEESQKPEVKPPPSNIDEFDQQEVKGNSTKVEKGVNPNVKRDEGIMDLNRKYTSKVSMQTPTIHSEKRSRVKGKVKEFVKIFNQEPSSRTKVDTETPSQSCRWKPTSINQTEVEVNLNAAKLDENVAVNKKPDISHSVDKNLSSNEAKRHSFRKSRSASFSTDRKNAIPSESLTKDSKASVENVDDPFEDIFVVQELSHDENEVTLDQSSEDNKASDSKIQQWSLGKKGNIRSLLSTLQYVLWPGSGWKPVPLVDLIEANSVKRSYQKALLCLHPDKLQQKGAASHQKYIAEKVFDILQEAWDHFNTIGV